MSKNTFQGLQAFPLPSGSLHKGEAHGEGPDMLHALVLALVREVGGWGKVRDLAQHQADNTVIVPTEGHLTV